MGTATTGRAAFRPLKSEPMMDWCEDKGRLLVTLIDRRQTEYEVLSLSTDIGGAAFRWKKRHGDKAEYGLLLNNGMSSCTCPGFCWTEGCKHLHATSQLVELEVLKLAPGSAGGDNDECSESCDF